MDDVFQELLRSKEDRLQRKFARRSKGISKQEKRELERKLLKPLRLPVKRLKTRSPVDERTITLVFPSVGDVELFRRHFRVSEYKGLNTHHLDPLLEFLECLERGSLVFEKKTKKLEFVDDQGEPCTL